MPEWFQSFRRKKTTAAPVRIEGLLYSFTLDLKITPHAKHTLQGLQRRPYARRSLLPGVPIDSGMVQAILRYERRQSRRELGESLFYGEQNYGLCLRAHIETPPTRTVTLVAIPLSINVPGYSSTAILKKILQFLLWQAQQIQPDTILVYDPPTIVYEDSVLLEGTSYTKMYWLTAILSKYASIVGSER